MGVIAQMIEVLGLLMVFVGVMAFYYWSASYLDWHDSYPFLILGGAVAFGIGRRAA